MVDGNLRHWLADYPLLVWIESGNVYTLLSLPIVCDSYWEEERILSCNTGGMSAGTPDFIRLVYSKSAV